MNEKQKGYGNTPRPKAINGIKATAKDQGFPGKPVSEAMNKAHSIGLFHA